MATKQNELLSAFIDGELNSEELDELLELLDTDDNVRENCRRYQFFSDVLSGYNHKQPVDLTARIRTALADEPNHYINNAQETKKASVLMLPDWFWKKTAGYAAAASIGALAVIGVLNQPQNALTEFLLTAKMQSQITADSSSNRWTVGEKEVQELLNNYLINHNEFAAPNLFSSARVVSYVEE